MSTPAVPRVRGNDWGVLDAPGPGDLTPRRSVSVVIPAHRAGATLPYTLAALAAQSYPSHLLEVVVVDDGEDEPVRLPELVPQQVRIVRAEDSWGRAHACGVGASVAEGDVIHWLDADMVPARDEVERQMRWHHVLDHAVGLGHKLFVDDEDLPAVADVHAAASAGRLADLFAERVVGEHEWVEAIWRRTDDLRGAGFRAFHVHVGSTASVSRELYADAGGMDPALKLGEDVELGYRLAMRGAVFVGDRSATCWHLGRSQLMQHQEQVQRYNAPFIAQRVPDFRKFREESGRAYRVPYVEVVVEVDGRPFEEVKHTVDGVLHARPQDVRCRLVGPWSGLQDERRQPLWDTQLDLRLLQEEYDGEPRVELVEKVEQSAFPAQYRLHLPVGWSPGPRTLARLTRQMQRRDQGLRSVLLADGRVARLEATAAFERARRVTLEGEELDDVVDAVSGSRWTEGEEEGFLPYHPPAPEVEARTPPETEARLAPETEPRLAPVVEVGAKRASKPPAAQGAQPGPRTVVRRALSLLRRRPGKE